MKNSISIFLNSILWLLASTLFSQSSQDSTYTFAKVDSNYVLVTQGREYRDRIDIDSITVFQQAIIDWQATGEASHREEEKYKSRRKLAARMIRKLQRKEAKGYEKGFHKLITKQVEGAEGFGELTYAQGLRLQFANRASIESEFSRKELQHIATILTISKKGTKTDISTAIWNEIDK